MLRRVALIRPDVSEELRASTNNVPNEVILVNLMIETLRSSETSALTRATRRKTQEDGILQILRLYLLRNCSVCAAQCSVFLTIHVAEIVDL
jgi:hypothetical protein